MTAKPTGARNKFRPSWPIDPGHLVLGLIFIILAVNLSTYGYHGVASDGSNYFAYLRSAVFDHDLNFHNEFAHFNKAFWDTYRPKETITGHYTNVFSVGPAILWAPFYLAAHLLVVAANLGGAHIIQDGFSGPYTLAINLASVFYAYLGICLVYSLCKKFFSTGASLTSALGVWFGTFLFYYTVCEPYMSHAVAFFSSTLFIYFWHTTRKNRTTPQWCVLGLAAGLMMLVRWQNGLIMILPALEALTLYYRFLCQRQWPRLKGLVIGNFLFLSCAFLAFLPQMTAWKVIYGSFLTIPQGSGFLRWNAPFMSEVLFASRHGLFAWTPLVYCSVIGWLAFFRRDKLFAFGGLLSFLLTTYINSVVSDWWAGWGFGMRRFDGLIILFALGLALFIDLIRRASPRSGLTIGAVICLFFTGFNMFLLDNYAKTIPPGGPVAFNKILGLSETGFYRYTGYPFSFPANLVFAARYHLPPSRYDTLVGGYVDDPHFYGDTILPAQNTILLGHGWSPPLSFQGTPVRSVAQRAVVYVPVRTVTDFSVSLRTAGQQVSPTGVAVLLNGSRIGTIYPQKALGQCTLKLSGKLLQPGINTIEFINNSRGNLFVQSLKFKRLQYVPDWR